MTRKLSSLTTMVALTIAFAGCQPIGRATAYKTLAPKSSPDDVQVFEDESPRRAHEEVGHIDLRSVESLPNEYTKLIDAARVRAARMGADAIIVKRHPIRETEMVETGGEGHRHRELVVTERPAISAIAIVWTEARGGSR